MNAALGNDVGENSAPTFTSETATATGKSVRAVQLDAERGEKVCAEAPDLLRPAVARQLRQPLRG